MPHTYTDQTEPIRSGVAKLFFWMGLALAGVGVVMGVTFIVWGLLTTNDDGLVTTGVILGPLFLAAGALMHLGGRRQWVRLLPDGLVWRTVFSGPTYVPWRCRCPHPRVTRCCWRSTTVDGSLCRRSE